MHTSPSHTEAPFTKTGLKKFLNGLLFYLQCGVKFWGELDKVANLVIKIHEHAIDNPRHDTKHIQEKIIAHAKTKASLYIAVINGRCRNHKPSNT